MALAKLETLEKIVTSGVVAVVRAESPDEACRIADACAEGGIIAIEITFTVPGAVSVIETLARRDLSGKMLIGAGTVLDVETADKAITAGARFVVSPCLRPEVARFCNDRQVPHLPGAGTATEIVEAMESGAEIVKIFPGEILGPKFVKAVKGPLPDASLMPTGGVTLENVTEWIHAGCVAVGVGGSLTVSAKRGDFATIVAQAKQFVAKVREARASHK
ncbi:MAG: bifunctional 2-keto-4-hydroxyglutarate aldolase/2-keto-3-deoxy-6-phosphogluconate aldolase [Terriglobales bacterium]|jgi:2-dehydro-3-deoxyphosphogluconate aldolase/(4S)-4-hydroxy-2-oxoglutarate aldolase